MERSVKLLLTLLVLLGGFAALPAQARSCAGSGIEQVQPSPGGLQPLAAVNTAERALAPPLGATRERDSVRQLGAAVASTVQQGDRALE